MSACLPHSIRLVALDGALEIRVGRPPVVIGRLPNCDVTIDSMRVSRRHCFVAEVEGGVLVRDLGSTNGIQINGRRVVAGTLKPGDELAIAHLRFRIEGDDVSTSRTALRPG